MAQGRIPAVFMRGGTSKAVMFRAADLPGNRAACDAIFLDVIGSPDPNGRQLDGMGGGVSSLSKVCIIGPPSRLDADVDYTFAQVSVSEASVDYSANCGNMSSAIGPFAVDEGLVRSVRDGDAVVRIHNTNTGKIIRATFPVADGQAEVEGSFVLDGVGGTGAAIRLDFEQPAGSKTGRLLPAGAATTWLDIPGLGRIVGALVDAATPCVFVSASDLGKSGTELPAELEGDAATLQHLATIRSVASVAMGTATNLEAAARVPGVPRVAMVSAPAASATLSGRALAASDVDLTVRMISMGQPHRAVPLTGALCLAVASQVPGSIPHGLKRPGPGPIRIGHASGITVVDAVMEEATAGLEVRSAAVFRTARRLFEGHVRVRAGVSPLGALQLHGGGRVIETSIPELAR